MKAIRNYIAMAGIIFASTFSFAQDEMEDKEMKDEPAQSNVQQYTPSKLLGKANGTSNFLMAYILKRVRLMVVVKHKIFLEKTFSRIRRKYIRE